ncbi:hypothetical protein GCM10017771_32340 [Streptomyces capitiformicae]|uniref:Rhamnogalacturonan lyase family 11 C-terminal domain-containing protein n=1 Tax=Streptomyces capitiformicae TaxID=2014920 RepID=A0A919GPU3_9ACTN|nr:hypothetical protein GCM10017771_32340 [Streptomyces capitiformicae]
MHAVQLRTGYKDVPISAPAGGTTPDGVAYTYEANDASVGDLDGDILGDWREEVVWRASGNTALRIYSTPIETTTKITTLLHDPMYRTGLAWQNTAYNQPPHTSFFIGNNMPTAPRPTVYTP